MLGLKQERVRKRDTYREGERERAKIWSRRRTVRVIVQKQRAVRLLKCKSEIKPMEPIARARSSRRRSAIVQHPVFSAAHANIPLRGQRDDPSSPPQLKNRK